MASRAARTAPSTLSLANVAVASDHMAFAPRQSLYCQGDPGTHVFILKEGTARLTHLLADGRQASIGLRFEGDMLGLAPGPVHQMGAEALTAVLAGASAAANSSACSVSTQRWSVISSTFVHANWPPPKTNSLRSAD